MHQRWKIFPRYVLLQPGDSYNQVMQLLQPGNAHILAGQVNGNATCGNHGLLTTILRDTWKWDGGCHSKDAGCQQPGCCRTELCDLLVAARSV